MSLFAAITTAERRALWAAIDAYGYQVRVMHEVPGITEEMVAHERAKLALARRAYLKLNKALKAAKAQKEAA